MKVNMLRSVIFLLFFTYSTADVTFTITNNDGGPIWVGIQGNSGKPPLRNGGFILEQGQTTTVTSADDWAGRFWSRTWCDPNTQHCLTGDCGNKLECNGAGGAPPATLAEITLKGYGGLDNYDISLVDGYNSKASIEPVNGQSDGSQYSCKKASCGNNVDDVCPGELQVKNDQNVVIGCLSACAKFNTDEYCCRGAHDTEPTCRSTDWPVNYPKIFKDQCPDAYSYAYDDHKSLFTCKAQAYNIVFG